MSDLVERLRAFDTHPESAAQMAADRITALEAQVAAADRLAATLEDQAIIPKLVAADLAAYLATKEPKP